MALSSSLVYRSTWVYELIMVLLYGRHYAARYRAVADLVPRGASVLELCCGPGILFDRYLRRKGCDYLGLDINRGFIDRIQRRGGRAQIWDLHADTPLPRADIVVMQASLYHFLPDPAPVVDRMRAAAGRSVIIAEPVRNLSDSRIPVLSALARRHTDPGVGQAPLRFSEATLDAFLGSREPGPSRSFLIPGGREKIYVFETAGAGSAST
jgi:SAM-dependent methyltransferase